MDYFIVKIDTLIVKLTNNKMKHSAKQADLLKRKVLKNKKISSLDQNEFDQLECALRNYR